MIKIDGSPHQTCEKCYGEMIFHECYSVMGIRPFYRMVCTSLGCGNFGPVVEECHFKAIMRSHKAKDRNNAVR